MLRQGLATSLSTLMTVPSTMYDTGLEEEDTPSATFVRFNQDNTCLAVGTISSYTLYSLNSTDTLEPVYISDEPEVYISERLFSSSLVAVVSNLSPRTLRVCHFKKGTEICRYSYSDKVRAVRMNRARLVVCLDESLYIHNIRDMKVIHTIRDTPSNPAGLLALSTDSTHNYLAYPGHSNTGELQVFDTINLASRVIIPAHESQLAAMQFSPSGTRIATASERGTVIRVFSCQDGSKLYELRRGLKRTASIFSLSFSPCGSFLACSSNTETVHVFKLDDKPRDSYSLAGSPPSDSEGWFGYINNMVSVSAGYLPSQMTDTLLQGRAFASVHHNQNGSKNTCALAMIRRSLRLVVCSVEGTLQLYSFDQDEGGDCSLIREFILDGTPAASNELVKDNIVQIDNIVVPGETEHDNIVPGEIAGDNFNTDKIRISEEPTESDTESFHEMSSTPVPRTCFLLDDDGDFPPVAFAAS